MRTYLSKDGLYVLTVEQDPTYYPDPIEMDTDLFIDGVDEVDVQEKLADLLGGEEAYQIEHDKFDNAHDLFSDLNRVGEKEGFWIVPIWKFEHDNVVFGIGTRTGWDASTVGFASIKTTNAKRNGYRDRQDWVNAVQIYLSELNKLESGEIYDLEVRNSQTDDIVDSVGGFMFDDNDSNEKKQMVQALSDELIDLGEKYNEPDFWANAKRTTRVVVSYDFDEE